MSDHDAHVPDLHGSTAGHDDHGHDVDTLGPVGWTMWGVGVIGVVIAILIAAAFVFSTGFAFNA